METEEYQEDFGGEYQQESGATQNGESASFNGGFSGSGDGGNLVDASKNSDDDRKIFVGGLSWETTGESLKSYFEKYGPILDCTIKMDPETGRSRGFGFVLFSDFGSVDKVLSDKHMLHGRVIDPKRAKARGSHSPIKKLFVGGIDPNVPDSDIREYFSKFGKIEEMDLPYDKVKGQRRAFCFITFESEDIVDQICQNPKQILGGKEVDVKKATPKSENGQNGSRGGRGGFRGGRGGRGTRGGSSWGGDSGRGGYDYSGYYGAQPSYGQGGYDYYGQGYSQPGYDYSSYYAQTGWGDYSQGAYAGYTAGADASGWGGYTAESADSTQQSGYGKVKPPAPRGGLNSQYHPYQRQTY